MLLTNQRWMETHSSNHRTSMNFAIVRLAAVFVFISAATSNGPGIFQNLDFEASTLTPVPTGQFGGPVPVSEAIPDWTAYLGGVQTTQALQNNFTLGSASVDIFTPDWSVSPGIIDGGYSVYLQPGGTITSIAQTGMIPYGSKSLIFDAWQPPVATPFSVSFGGDTLSAVVISTGQSPSGQAYNVYGANIASFAGQTG
jgi:hypothetical protein